MYGNLRDRRTYASDIPDAAAKHGRKWPQTRAEWDEEYGRRMDAYLSLPYLLSDVKALHLFRAMDPDGQIIDQTRRLLRDVTYVCDTDAAALVGEGLTVDAAPTLEDGARERWAKEATGVWWRSRLAHHVQRHAINFSVMGAQFWEATLGPDGKSRVVCHQAPHFTVEYDSQNVSPERVSIMLDTFVPSDRDARTGELLDGERDDLSTYVREITASEIRVWRDGRYVEDESGPNVLGVIPGAHVVFQPVGEPEHGLGAAHGLDEMIAMVNSGLTQLAAIGNRYGSPFYVAKGFKLAGGTLFGRTINGVPETGDFSVLEPSLQGAVALLNAAQVHHAALRDTLPEFALRDAAAQASGEALRQRAMQFVAKMRPIRERWHGAIAEVTAMAIALDDRRAWRDEDHGVLRVDAGPIIPADIGAELDRILKLRSLEPAGITDADFVRHLQRIGLVDGDEDPVDYADQLVAEATDAMVRQSAPARALQDAAGALFGRPEVQVTAEGGEGEPAPDAPAPAEEEAAPEPLNGAQIASALDIVTRVATGELPRSEAISMLGEFLNLDAARAERVMGSIGRSFKIKTEAPAKPAP